MKDCGCNRLSCTESFPQRLAILLTYDEIWFRVRESLLVSRWHKLLFQKRLALAACRTA